MSSERTYLGGKIICSVVFTIQLKIPTIIYLFTFLQLNEKYTSYFFIPLLPLHVSGTIQDNPPSKEGII